VKVLIRSHECAVAAASPVPRLIGSGNLAGCDDQSALSEIHCPLSGRILARCGTFMTYEMDFLRTR
jgi:hypothetical protein